MDTDILRAASGRVTHWHGRFKAKFGRIEAQEHARVYIRGLLSNLKRKNAEAIAMAFTKLKNDSEVSEKDVVALQGFVTASPWEAGEVQKEIQAVFSEELAPTCESWPLGVVGVIDESGFTKQGTESVGVAHQYCGRYGKTMNCQVGVFLVGVTPLGSALLDHQLFLPESWIEDHVRRDKTQVPPDQTYQSKPQIAAEMIRRTHDAGHIRLSWIIGDKLYGSSGPLIDQLDRQHQRYMFQVKPNRTVWVEDPGNRMSTTLGTKRRRRLGVTRHPSVRSMKELANELPANAWQRLQLRDGAKGPLVYDFARRRVWLARKGKHSTPVWVVFPRSLNAQEEMRYHISNAGEDVAIEEMALAIGSRWRVEELFKDAKGQLGMSDYETRAWRSWHHHMSLVALAHLYVTLTKLEVGRDIPEFTLNTAVRVLQASFARKTLTQDNAINVIEYHMRCNQKARKSHRKSRQNEGENGKPKVLL